MKTPVYTSYKSHIHAHKIIGELGYVRVEAKEFKNGIDPNTFFGSFLFGLTWGDSAPRFDSTTEAMEYLKEKVRKMDGNGIINITYSSSRIDGIAVKVEKE